MGITGGSGAGTTTACGFFKDMGVPAISADVLARKCTIPSHPAFAKIKKEFPGVMDGERRLDRRKLAERVFTPSMSCGINKLNKIIHPYVDKDLRKFIREHRGSRLIVLDIPLLFEAGFEKHLNGVLFIECPKRIRLKRLRERDRLTLNELNNRLRYQMTPALKKKKSNWVINNDCQVSHFINKLKIFYKKLMNDINCGLI